MTFPESTPPSQNIPPFSTNVYVRSSQSLPLSPRINPPFQQLYATLPESTRLSQNKTPLFNNCMRPSQNLPVSPRIYTPPPPFNRYNIMRPTQNLHLPPRIYPPFQLIYMCDHPRIYPVSPRIYPHFNNYV